MFKNKIKASLIHFLISILLVGLVIGSVIFFFFPQHFIHVSNFKEVAIIIITVDLILGPLLTFVVFKPNKKSLKFDLSVIAAIQISALTYGVYALYQVHPVFVTFNVDRFTIVSARDAEPEKSKYDEYRVSKLSAGKLAYVKLPKAPEERLAITIEAARGGEDIDRREEYYKPFKDNFEQILSRSLDPKIIFSNERTKQKAAKFLSNNVDKLDSYAFFPLNSDNKEAVIVLDRQTSKPIATLDIDPWKISESSLNR